MAIDVKAEARGVLARVRAKVSYEIDNVKNRIDKYNSELQVKNDNYLRSIGASEGEISSMNDAMQSISSDYYDIYSGVGSAVYSTQSAKVKLAEDALANLDGILGSDELMNLIGKKMAEKFSKKTGLNIDNFYPFEELPEKLSLIIGQEINQKAGFIIFTDGILPPKSAVAQIKAAAVNIVKNKTGVEITTLDRYEFLKQMYAYMNRMGMLKINYHNDAISMWRLRNRTRQAEYRQRHKQRYTGYT